MSKRRPILSLFKCESLLVGFLLVTVSLSAAEPAAYEGAGQATSESNPASIDCKPMAQCSPYIPVDSWVYPAVWRLYAMGYIDHVYLGMRPWTRASLVHILEGIDAQIEDADTYGDSTAGEAQDIRASLVHFLHDEKGMHCSTTTAGVQIESLYSAARAISGLSLNDSFELGSTIINDYGRPYENGFNNYSGASGYANAGRFVLYARGEFHDAPSAAGYSNALAEQLANIDGTTDYYINTTTYPTFPPSPPIPLDQLATIPAGPITAVGDFHFIEAYISAHVLNHEISFGKQDDWLAPGQGGAFAYSNNAENIYAFRINRIEPLNIPMLSRLTGPFRYEFLIGPLKGHAFPIDPWVHVEKISFRPTDDLEFGFERTVIWGGKGHSPITIHSFLKSFVSLVAPDADVKFSRNDPGARFGAFDFSYRLPFARNWLTLYGDSEAHDDVSPIDNPPRASWRPGIYLAHVPGIPKLDLRVEAASTDPSSSNHVSQNGQFMYWETVQRQGYTNRGQLFGDWIGREDKGGQAWITYHLSGNEWIQVGVRNQKASKDFIPGGTTLNDINFQVVKRIGKDIEIDGRFAYERWKAPIYMPSQQTVTTSTIQVTWFPERKVSF